MSVLWPIVVIMEGIVELAAVHRIRGLRSSRIDQLAFCFTEFAMHGLEA